MAAQIEVFPCLEDNYGFLLHDSSTGATAAIDAPDAAPIRAALKHHNWTLSDILITHHHWDHTDGIVALKTEFNARVTGPAAEARQIKGLDQPVRGGDKVCVGEIELVVIETPGHTVGHITYYEPGGKSLFSGDALFSLGCGRMFEGTPGPMWQGLQRLRQLPDDTMVFCGHEYSAANAAFAQSIDPDNLALKQRAIQIAALRKEQRPSIPFPLGEDKRANPFLRADDPALGERLNLKGSPPAKVFAAIRKAKDNF